MRSSSAALLLALALVGTVTLWPLGMRAERAAPPPNPLRLVLEPGDVVQETSTDEPVDAEVLTRMVLLRRAAFLGCYERELPGTPAAGGHIVLAVTVTTAGTTTAVIREKAVPSDAVADCAVRVVHGFRFNPPPSQGAVTFAVRLRYEPTPAAPR